jgi:GR25 family glycosyltransferase involved in LPS biosynthesis
MVFKKKQAIFWVRFIIIALSLIFIAYLLNTHFFSNINQGFTSSHNNYIIYYINLDHRTDRNEQFLSELSKIGIPSEKIIRIPAVYNKEHGDVGCSNSHILTIETFMKSDYDRCIVFEDDFVFINKTPDLANYFIQFQNAEKNEGLVWDVVLFSANEVDTLPTEYPFLMKINNSQTASGYMVSKKYAPTLLSNFKEGVVKLDAGYKNNDSNPGGSYAIDQYWKLLQKTDNWYRFEPKLGKQRESYSDIQKGVMDYGV